MKTADSLFHQNLILLCILCSITTLPNIWCSSVRANPDSSVYVTKSCKTTLYPKLCNKTLSKHAEKIKSSPKLLAMSALIASFNATQTTSKVLRRVKAAAAIECVELVGDALYELHRSIKRLNQSRKGAQFFLQMDDVQTWVSAALTDDDTCIDDFKAVGRTKVFVRGLVFTIARLASIALTFINSYAAL